MKLLKLVFIIFFCNIAFTAQTQSVKTVGLFLGLQEGCPLPKPGTSPIPKKRGGAMEEVESPPPNSSSKPPIKKEIIPPTDEASWRKALQSYIKGHTPKRASMSIEGNEFFQDENHLWGLKNSTGKVIVKPCFEVAQISPANKSRFVGKKIGVKGFNVFDKNGKAILKKNYQHIHYYISEKHITIHSKGKQGVASVDGKILIKPKYDIISSFNNGWVVHQNKLLGVVNYEGKVLIPPKYKKLNIAKTNDKHTYTFVPETNGELTIYKNKKVAYRLGIKYYEHAAGRIYDGRYLFYNHQLIDLKKNQYILCGGNIKIETHQHAYNLFTIKKDKDHWVFNEKGELFSELAVLGRPHYMQFENGLTIVALNTGEKNPFGYPIAKVGILNTKMEWVLPTDYGYMNFIPNSNLYVAAKIGGKAGVIDITGSTVIPYEYLRITPMGEKLFCYRNRKSTLVEVLDWSGKKLFEKNLEHKDVSSISGGYTARRKSDNKKVILNDQFDEIYNKKFYNLRTLIKDEAVWFEDFGSPNTQYVIGFDGNPYSLVLDGEPRSDYKQIKHYWSTPFYQIKCADDSKYLYNSNTQKGFKLDDKINSIDVSLYKSLGLLISVREDKKNKGLIDTLGQEILPPNFKNIYNSGAFFTIITEHRSHTFTATGRELFGEYDAAYFLYHNFFAVKKNGKVGVVNIKGDIIIPFNYEYINKDSIFNLRAKTLSGQNILMGLDGVKIKKI